MHSSRTQWGPLMNRLTFPCLSVVVCFLLLLARRMHVSFSHAWSASKPKEKSEDTEMYYSSHTFSGCSKNCQCIFQQSFEKEPDFPEICEIRSKKCQEKVLYLELWENAISQPVGDIYWGKVNQPCDDTWMDKHNATRGTIEKGTMANIPHVNCDCTEHRLQFTIRHSNELGVSLKCSKSSDREGK